MAKRQSARLDPGLISLLQEQAGGAFTVQSIVDDYANRFGLASNSSMKGLRQWLYRRLVYLVKSQLLTKRDTEGGAAEYLVTNAFRQRFMDEQCDAEANQSDGAERLGELRHRLSQYHVDMLACAGECKEYQLLVLEFPHLRSEIEQMHQAAKDRSSELIGQIRAINKFLQNSTSN